MTPQYDPWRATRANLASFTAGILLADIDQAHPRRDRGPVMNDRERRLILAALDPDMSDSAPVKHDTTMPAHLAAVALNAVSMVLWSTAADLHTGDSLNSMVLTERCQAFADALDVIDTPLGRVRVDWFSGRLLLLDTATRIYDREAVAS